MPEDVQNPKPFKKAHKAIMGGSIYDTNQSRHDLGGGMHAIMASEPGVSQPSLVAYEFDAAMWTSDKALEWLLASHKYVARFVRAE